MRWTSVLAIYFILWFLCLFLVLPFRLQRRGAADSHVPGQADSAPPAFSPARTAVWTTVVAGVLMALFALNYREGWITASMLDLFS